MANAYIGLGSNLDDPLGQVNTALKALDALPETSVCRTSRWYRTPPLGPSDQPDFVNGAALIETALKPKALLAALQQIESNQGRIRSQHWGPRTLDLDILLYNRETIQEPDLRIPHPGLTSRAFVLMPLRDIDPTLVLPNGESVSALLEKVSTEGIVALS
ncbi:MAG: 2-amino-4-hydroxy-6-hydroxymethyldihydropteridine diphosphokinase [bacterium]